MLAKRLAASSPLKVVRFNVVAFGAHVVVVVDILHDRMPRSKLFHMLWFLLSSEVGSEPPLLGFNLANELGRTGMRPSRPSKLLFLLIFIPFFSGLVVRECGINIVRA